MPHPLKAVVILARCCKVGELFGLRFETSSADSWAATWAFPVREPSAGREGYDRRSIAGSFTFSAEYPGCPHCDAFSIFRCGCGKAGCWNGNDRAVQCRWCGATSELAGAIDHLAASPDP